MSARAGAGPHQPVDLGLRVERHPRSLVRVFVLKEQPASVVASVCGYDWAW